MFYGVKKRERIAYAVAGGGLAIGLMGMIAVVTMLPLKQTEAFLAIVDKDTGVAERVVAVEKASDYSARRMNEVRSGFMHGKTEHHHLRDQARSDAERGQAARARLGQFIRDS